MLLCAKVVYNPPMAKKKEKRPLSVAEAGSKGGRTAAKNMTPEQRLARSEKANRAKKRKQKLLHQVQ